MISEGSLMRDSLFCSDWNGFQNFPKFLLELRILENHLVHLVHMMQQQYLPLLLNQKLLL